jgi:hypothetical protein
MSSVSLPLTQRQRWYLNLISAKPISTADALEGRRLVERFETYDSCYSSLNRLKRRGLILRVDGFWQAAPKQDGEASKAAIGTVT